MRFFWNLLKLPLKLLPKKNYLKIRRFLLSKLIFFGYSNSLSRLDKRIIKFFNFQREGFFIEVGAADGMDQSNTFLLERKYGWKGLLIEPRKEEYKVCKKIRKNSIVVNYALSNLKDDGNRTLVEDTGLTSKITSKQEGMNISEVKNISLSRLLKENKIDHVDIMSLDVEGYEFEVLEGYSSKSKVIDYLLVETINLQKFQEYAEAKEWIYLGHWGSGDYLFRLKRD